MSIEADGEDVVPPGRLATTAQVPRRMALAWKTSALGTIAIWRKSVSFWPRSQKIQTYDPIVLADRGVLGVAADLVVARSWYERAKEMGSPEGLHRLDMLANR
jgi:hypothetical protein